MSFAPRSMKRRNVKGLALNAESQQPAPSAGGSLAPDEYSNYDREDALEIGVEFRLDLHAEDLIPLKELGAGNGGSVSKVQHAATKAIMARKASSLFPTVTAVSDPNPLRSSTSKRRRRYGNA